MVNNVNIPAQFLTGLGSLMSFIETDIAHSPILDHDGGRAIVRRLIELIATPKRATACIVLTQLLERFGTQVNATEMDAIRADVIDVKQTHDKKNKTSPAVQKSMLSNMFFYLCLIRAGFVPVSEAKFGALKKYMELFVEAARHEPLQAIAAESYIMVIELAIKSKVSAASIKKKLVDPYFGALVTKSVDQLSSLSEFYIVAKLDHLLKVCLHDNANVLGPNLTSKCTLTQKFCWTLCEILARMPTSTIRNRIFTSIITSEETINRYTFDDKFNRANTSKKRRCTI